MRCRPQPQTGSASAELHADASSQVPDDLVAALVLNLASPVSGLRRKTLESRPAPQDAQLDNFRIEEETISMLHGLDGIGCWCHQELELASIEKAAEESRGPHGSAALVVMEESRTLAHAMQRRRRGRHQCLSRGPPDSRARGRDDVTSFCAPVRVIGFPPCVRFFIVLEMAMFRR